MVMKVRSFRSSFGLLVLTSTIIVAENDPYVELTDRGMEAFSVALTFFPVNALPARESTPLRLADLVVLTRYLLVPKSNISLTGSPVYSSRR